uniref:hypothetical protein n=1 Tax=Rahnella sp. ChDrAdgB13 TaxID=1850581 RepID=UPI001AD8959A
MSKMTFVVDFPDGQEPAVGAGSDILGGKLVSVAFSDISMRREWHSVDELPPFNCALWATYSDGSTGVDCFSEHMGWDSDRDAEDIYVTHWMELPEAAEVDGE